MCVLHILFNTSRLSCFSLSLSYLTLSSLGRFEDASLIKTMQRFTGAQAAGLKIDSKCNILAFLTYMYSLSYTI
jgi:hypothetical protein